MAYTWSSTITNTTWVASGKPMKAGVHQLTYDKIPASWFSGDNLRNLKWEGSKLVLPDDPQGLLLTLRAHDEPNFYEAEHPGGKRGKGAVNFKFVWQNAASILVWKDAHGEQTFGDDLSKTGQLATSISRETQLPHLSIRNRFVTSVRPHPLHRIKVFGGPTLRKVTYHTTADLKMGRCPAKIPAKYAKAAQENRLFAITFDWADSKSYERHLDTLRCLHDKQSGTDERDIRKSDVEMIADMMALKFRSEFDKCLHMMYALKGATMTVFRELDPYSADMAKRFAQEYEHFAQMMNLCTAAKGPYWFYRMQSSFGPHGAVTFINPTTSGRISPPAPFWLVRTFQIHIARDESLQKVVPLTCRHMAKHPDMYSTSDWCLPHPKYAALHHELCMEGDGEDSRTKSRGRGL